MAVVYRAWDPLLNVFRAVKVLHGEAAAHPMLRQRFITEASTLTRLVHPNVLRIYDVGEEGTRCWYAMDLVEEGALQRRIETQGAMSAAEALKVVFQILQALGAAHRCGIIHRDVKPANVLLRSDGTVLLGDFGSARQAINAELTRTGDVLGTIGYMAPEQRADSKSAGPVADIYAVGATLYGLVTGRAPLGLFEGEIDSGPLSKLHPDVREIIRNATRYRPEHRYPTARHMALDVAKSYDNINGLQGAESARQRWMARFDLLIESSTPGSQPPSSATPTEPSLRNAYEVPRAPERTYSARGAQVREALPKTPQPVTRVEGGLVLRAWTWMRDLIDRWLVAPKGVPAALPQGNVLGAWDGKVADLLPLRIEIEKQVGPVIEGWAVTTGLRGQVVTRVEGRFDDATSSFEVEEKSERPDRGRYIGTLKDGRLEGDFLPVDRSARAMPFWLTRGKR